MTQDWYGHTYAKKSDNPSRTTGLSTPVFGFFTVIVCESFGIVAKKVSISLNCFELKDSINSFNSFLVQSFADQDSSSLKICSIHELTMLNVSSTLHHSIQNYFLQTHPLMDISFSIQGYHQV